MLRRMVFAFVIVGLCASTLCAQDQERRRRGGQGGQRPGMGQGGGGAMLLANEDVRKDLKLSEEQTKKLSEISSKQREAMRDLRDMSPEERREKMQEMTKETMSVLNPDQQKRFKQIQLQAGGVMAGLNNPEVKKELNLTSEQEDKIKAINDDQRSQMREMFQGGGGGGDRQESMRKMQEMRQAAEKKVEGVLTDEQKTKWKEMLGEPFKGNLRPQGGRRPGQIG